tara:strand:+ start:206 stop:649 length:444 start_codon:yes stop_codon:yes gene_type:complete
MSLTTGDKASNNINPSFPAMMNGGELYTNWDSSCKMNNEIKQTVGLQDNYSYRQWLINNAQNVITTNHLSAIGQSCVYNTEKKIQDHVGLPKNKYIFSGCSDKTQPFGYEQSDLKSMYLSKYELERRIHTPILTQEQLIQAHMGNYN